MNDRTHDIVLAILNVKLTSSSNLIRVVFLHRNNL